MRELELRPGERIICSGGVDYWTEKPIGRGYLRTGGYLYVTNQRISFLDKGLFGLFVDTCCFDIDVKDLETYKKCFVGMFPIGLNIFTKDGERYIFGFNRRKKFIEALDMLLK